MNAQRPLTILVIDDEPPILELLQRIGQQVFPEASFIGVESPQQAFAYLVEQTAAQPQLILLDIDFHQAQTGLDAVLHLRTRLQGRVPIIMFTDLSAPSNVLQAYERGAVAYTQKPENLSGWKTYLEQLKNFWYQTAILPE